MALKERRGQDVVMTVSKASDASGDATVALTLTLAFVLEARSLARRALGISILYD
jgi:hypothetical protein